MTERPDADADADGAAGTPATRFHVVPDFKLAGGATLSQARAAYVTLGALNAERSNAILITHGYTSSHTFVLPDSTAAEGSWSDLVGPGRAIDTRRYFVISSNALGSSYGSTGPASTDPATGSAYGPDFPEIAFEDIARLQKSLVESFGIARLHAVAGVSMGGFQALQWGVQYPDAVGKLVVALSALTGSRVSAAGSKGLLDALATDPNWHGGRSAPGSMRAFLARLRVDTLRKYGMDAWLADQSLDEAARTQRMQAMADEWATGFDANALVTLMKAIERFDVRDRLSAIKARVLLVLSTTDALFPASDGPDTAQAMNAAGVDTTFHRLDTRYGHLASGLDWQGWSAELRKFLD